jgi:hypothetical protein
MPSCPIGYPRIDQLGATILDAGLVIAAIPCPAWFLAGKAFQRYRSASGRKTGVLPDFFVGAHAVIADIVLITRDEARYRSYFPGIMLIARTDLCCGKHHQATPAGYQKRSAPGLADRRASSCSGRSVGEGAHRE